MAFELLLFIVGFAILITSARILVSGAVSIARILKISSWVIGIVIVGLGTSIPELAVSISSSFAGNNIGIGAIIGGNTFNLLVILGLVAAFSPIFIRREWYKDIFINIGAVFASSLVVLLPILGDQDFVGITRLEGVLLSVIFVIWFVFMLKRKAIEGDEGDYQVFATFASVVMLFVGMIGVFVGGQWVVSGAEAIAHFLSVSPVIIGLTVVGVGTSLPELTVSLVALMKRQKGIAVGNIIGSNIFGFLGILGITGLIKPIAVIEHIALDIIIAVIVAVVVAVLALFTGERGVLSRREGILLVLSYFVYLFLIMMNI
ncbi:MAG: calcium/sodium antiporter [Candidatus Pacebacteria bacterium]|nr:calcium/sodium antiporter [Candidatus Paceibacterota bacterium]